MHKEATLLRKIIEKITFIEEIVKQYGSVESSLEDAILSRAAILMHLETIAEQFEKLSENGFFEVLSRFDANDIKGIRRVRNYIAHQYDEVDDDIIMDIIKERLPVIKLSCKKLLQS
ncbi:MAG: DUF86 domain-containing protein [Campylobacterales bacterium]